MGSQPVGFIGLGAMGGPLSGHLMDAAFTVAGYDIDGERVAAHAARGGLRCSSVAEVAERAGVVVTSLPSVAAFERVLGELDGYEGVLLEISTLPLELKEAARRRLPGAVLDCPLSGTGDQARSKDVVAYLSGDVEAKDRVAAVLAGMTRDTYDLGEFGNGTRMKLVANLLVAVHNVAAAEALVLAERAGLDLATVLRAVGDGAGTSRCFELRGPRMVARNYAEPSIRAETFMKDLNIIGDYAAGLGAPTPLLEAATEVYRTALAQGRVDEDTACVHAVLRERGSRR